MRLKFVENSTGIAEDATEFKFHHSAQRETLQQPGSLPSYTAPPRRKMRLLVCGAGENLKSLLSKLPHIFDRGTEVHLLNQIPMVMREEFIGKKARERARS